MTKKLFVLAIVLVVLPASEILSPVEVFAQVDTAWVRRFTGSEESWAVAPTIAVDRRGNIYVSGTTYSSATARDYATIKYGPDGKVLWLRTYNGGEHWDECAQGMVIDDSGNVYVTGISRDPATASDVVTIKYRPNGDTAWISERYNGPENNHDVPQGITVDGSGNVYVTGYSYDYNGYEDYLTIKYQPNGDIAWANILKWPAGGEDLAHAIIVDSSGYIYVTGECFVSGWGNQVDYGTVKYYPNGDTAWTRTYAGPDSFFSWKVDVAKAIAIDSSQNIYVTGRSSGVTSFADYVTIKYYPNGQTAWVRRYDGSGSNQKEANAIAVDKSNNIYVTGWSMLPDTTLYDVATVKYNASGSELWVSKYNGPANGHDGAQAVALDDSGNIYVTGATYSGTSYDLLTIKYYPNGDTAWVRTYSDPGNSIGYDIAVDGSGNVYVSGQTGRDYITIKYVEGKTLILKDGSSSNNAIANRSFKIYKMSNNPPAMTETLLGELTADSTGRIKLPEGWFKTGDSIKVERVVHTEPARKHQSILPNMYSIKIDNGKFDTYTGAIYYDTLTTKIEQEVIVDHTTIMYDLLVSVEWDADQQYLENLRDGLKHMSNYIYDVTDGQVCFDSIIIFDNKINWDSADVKIYASNMVWPHVSNDVGGIFTLVNPINFPRKWFGNSDASRNGTYSENPLIFTASVDYRTKCHEFGHYGLGFYDEYLFVWGNKCPQVQNYGFMEYQYDGLEPYASEMSSDARYVDPNCRNTIQYSRRATSCWGYLEGQHEISIDGLLMPIIKPSERSLPAGQDYLEGPNNNKINLNFDVGRLLQAVLENFNGGAFTLTVINRDGLGFPIGNSKVTLFKNNRTWVIEEGNTADNGRISCLGVNNGDIIRAYARIGRPWFYGEFVVGGSGLSRLMNFYTTSPDGDSVEVVLRTVQGDYRMINGEEFEAENSFRYNLRLNRSFSQNPSLEFYSPSGQKYNYIFSPVTNGYEVSISDWLGSSGMFSVIAVDDSGYNFFVNNSYTVTYLSDSFFSRQIYGPEGACELRLDTLNTSFQKIFILSSDFPPLLNGLDSLVEQGGAVHSISAYPDISNLNGVNNYLVIRYSDIDLKNSPEMSLKIFKWNEASNQWEWMGGVVDTMRNEATSPIQSLGIYAAFTTALMRGDVNSDGKISLADVIYLANYILKGGPSPIPLQSADVNCDGKYTLADVILLARYLLLGEPFPC